MPPREEAGDDSAIAADTHLSHPSSPPEYLRQAHKCAQEHLLKGACGASVHSERTMSSHTGALGQEKNPATNQA